MGVTGKKLLYIGTLGGIRTHNLLIRSQALYPLSYEGTAAIIHENVTKPLALLTNYP